MFENTYPLHPPGERAKIYSVGDMIPNSFYVSGTTLYVWLENGSDPRNSVMRVAPDHVVSLYDCHHTVFDGLTVEYGFNGFKNQRDTTHHNTLVGSAYAVQFHAGKTGNHVINNIVQDAARSFFIWPSGALPQILDYNLYHNASAAPQWERDGVVYRTFTAYQQASRETHSRYADPGLAGPAEARLRPGSPAIDAGVALSEVTADFDDISRPQGAAYDAGVFEFRARSPSKGPEPAVPRQP